MKRDRPTRKADDHALFAGFVLVGLMSTACNLGSRYVFQVFAGYEVALAVANVVGVLSAFLMNRWFVFKPGDATVWAELSKFTLINVAGIVVSWMVSVLLFRQVLPALGFGWHPDLVAHAIGISVPVIPNYFAHRYWTFAKS